MKYREFANTKEKVSVIGHGTWGMGGFWGPRDDRQAINSLIKSFTLGINFVDTAAVYGNGHSESLIASALKESKAQNIFIATKVPPKNKQWPARANNIEETFPADHIVLETEKSLKNLRKDCVDLQQLHVWKDSWLDSANFLNAIHKLKSQGKIKYFGISINDHDPNSALEIVSSGLIDCVQVIYNIFDQTPEEKLFPLCQKHSVAVIVRVPFDEGSLTGTLNSKTEFHKKDWRKHYFTKDRLEELDKRLLKLKSLLDENSPDLATLALQFCLSHKAVTAVIPGMRQIKHVVKNCAVAELPSLSKEKQEGLKAFQWLRNYYPQHN